MFGEGSGAAAAEATGRREPEAEAAGRGLEPGQADAAGRAVKKRLRPARQRVLVQRLQAAHVVSERRACQVLRVARSSHRYRSVRDERAALRIRLRDLAASGIRYGYRRLWVLLRREGWPVNHKLIYRLYVEEGLQLLRKSPKRRKSCAVRVERPAARGTNETWSMDFMSDQLFEGQRFRILTLVDNFSRESLALRASNRFRGEDVVKVLELVSSQRGVPKRIQVDNGPEFISKSLDWWAYFNGVKLDFSRPGKPTDNALIESFNGKFRQECLNQHWFVSLPEAQEVIDAWRTDYNEHRPHSALGDRSPIEFAACSAGASPC